MFSLVSVCQFTRGVPYDQYPWCIGLYCSGPLLVLVPAPTLDIWHETYPEHQSWAPLWPGHSPLLVKSGGHHWKSVETCSLEDAHSTDILWPNHVCLECFSCWCCVLQWSAEKETTWLVTTFYLRHSPIKSTSLLRQTTALDWADLRWTSAPLPAINLTVGSEGWPLKFYFDIFHYRQSNLFSFSCSFWQNMPNNSLVLLWGWHPLCEPRIYHCLDPPLSRSTTALIHHCPDRPLPRPTTALIDHCPDPPLPWSTTAWIHHCPDSPLSRSTTALIHHCPDSPLSWSTTTLIHHCPDPPLPRPTTAQTHHCPGPSLPGSTTALIHHCPDPSLSRSTTVQIHHCPDPPLPGSITVRIHHCPDPSLPWSTIEATFARSVVSCDSVLMDSHSFFYSTHSTNLWKWRHTGSTSGSTNHTKVWLPQQGRLYVELQDTCKCWCKRILRH